MHPVGNSVSFSAGAAPHGPPGSARAAELNSKFDVGPIGRVSSRLVSSLPPHRLERGRLTGSGCHRPEQFWWPASTPMG
jgi:hypothetical protein